MNEQEKDDRRNEEASLTDRHAGFVDLKKEGRKEGEREKE
jgi:hypothetical protein